MVIHALLPMQEYLKVVAFFRVFILVFLSTHLYILLRLPALRGIFLFHTFVSMNFILYNICSLIQ